MLNFTQWTWLLITTVSLISMTEEESNEALCSIWPISPRLCNTFSIQDARMPCNEHHRNQVLVGSSEHRHTAALQLTLFLCCISLSFGDLLDYYNITALPIPSLLCTKMNLSPLLLPWSSSLTMVLAVDDALDHLLQPHHVDELAVGGRGQEVEERGGGLGRRDLQQGLLQLLAQGQLGRRLAAGLVLHGGHRVGAGHAGGTHGAHAPDSANPDAGHPGRARGLHVGQVHVDGRGGGRALGGRHLLAGGLY